MELERLIATEQRNDELVRRAAAEAEALVCAATKAAEERQATLADELDRLIREGAVAIAAEGDRRVAAIAAAARDGWARYHAVTAAQLADIVPRLVDMLVAETSGR